MLMRPRFGDTLRGIIVILELIIIEQESLIWYPLPIMCNKLIFNAMEQKLCKCLRCGKPVEDVEYIRYGGYHRLCYHALRMTEKERQYEKTSKNTALSQVVTNGI